MSRSEYSWVSWFETSSGQLSLAIHSILCGAPNDFLAWFGIKCSSFSKMNIGTSMRSPFASIGCYDHPSVKMANGMLERTLPKHIPKWRWTKPRGLYAISNWCIYNWGIYILYYYYIYNIYIHVLGPCFVWLILGTISIPSEPFWTEQTCCPSRTVLLILLVTILGGAWALEQPSGSLLEFYPAFRHMLAAIFKWGGDCAVGVLDQPMFVLQNCWHIYICEGSNQGYRFIFRAPKVTKVSWWMAHYKAPTQKRHWCYANTPLIMKLDQGKLSGFTSRVQTAKRWKDRNGKYHYQGTSALRGTQNL